MTKRYFIRVRQSDGFIDQDLEVERPSGDWGSFTLIPPAGYEFVEMTDDPTWPGLGVLPGKIRQLDGAVIRAPRRVLRKLEFVQRFTLPEQTQMETLAQTNGNLAAFLRRMNYRDDVNLDDQEIIDFIGFLRNQNVLTAPRALAMRVDG